MSADAFFVASAALVAVTATTPMNGSSAGAV
jgi:hypothetical protein